MRGGIPTSWITVATLGLILALPAAAQPDYTSDFDRDRCTFTTTGSNPYFPLWPGHSLVLRGEEEDEGEIVEVETRNTVLPESELVDGVLTRVYEERELEDGELVEVSRNFVALCRETGDVWYFGEDVDDYEDGEIVGHEGEWRAGVDGAMPGIIMPGSPLIGARYFQEIAPGVAEDQGEVANLGLTVTVPAGTFTQVLHVLDTNALEPGALDNKLYAPGVGVIVDEILELIEVIPPPCQPDATTQCLNDGRFRVTAEWRDFQANEGAGMAILPSDDSGEFWFFSPNNTELLVKILDACGLPEFNSFWVFAGGLTNVEVILSVTDTASSQTRIYESPLGTDFAPVLDTAAFATCP